MSRLAKLVRFILLSLLASLLAGFLLGTLLRARLEGPPVRYFVEVGSACAAARA